MTLPTSGLITLLDIQNEFGGSNPIFLNEYYRGGGVVPIGTAAGTGSFQDTPLAYAAPAQIATSGTIQLSMFRGTSAVVPFVLDVTLILYNQDFNMRNHALLMGWDGVSPLIMSVTLGGSGGAAYVTSSSTSTPAFTTRSPADPNFPAGSSLTLTINGGSTIAGRGGNGGTGASISSETSIGAGSSGGNGGLGLRVLDPLTVISNGTIGGGGGGGGGGGATVVISGSGKSASSVGLSGGGGGAGAGGTFLGGTPPAGGAGGFVLGCDSTVLGTAGVNGQNGPGNGGAGPTAAGSTSTSAGSGGTGGQLGQPGQPGRSLTGSIGGAGGAAGPAIEGNANITWGSLGTILGAGWTSPYSLSASVNPVNEGSSVTITLNGSGVNGTSVPYVITGVSSADISGASITGNFTVGTAPTQVFNIAADGLTEGTETLTVALTPPSGQTSSPSVAVTINDTSFGAGELLASGSNIWQIENYTVYPVIAQTNIQFTSNGNTNYPTGPEPPNVVSGSNWFTVPTAGIGSSYWIRLTVQSQTTFPVQGSPVNMWLSLSIARSWYIQSALSAAQNTAGATRIEQATYTIEIATDAAGTNIVRTYSNNTFYAEATSNII